jgi:hypothetical protein
MRGGAYSIVNPFHNDLLMRKSRENCPKKLPHPKRNCELMRAKLPHDMPGNLNMGKSRNWQMIHDA